MPQDIAFTVAPLPLAAARCQLAAERLEQVDAVILAVNKPQ